MNEVWVGATLTQLAVSHDFIIVSNSKLLVSVTEAIRIRGGATI